MALSGFFDIWIPPTIQKSMVQAGPNRIDRGMETVKIAFRFHSNNAGTIRTAKSTKENTFMKIIKIGHYVTVPPHPGGTASWALIRFDPIKIATLSVNILEFCTNEKYHFFVFLFLVGKSDLCLGGIGRLTVPPFSK